MRLLLTITALTALVGATTASGEQSISRAQRCAQAQVGYQTGQYGAAKHHLRLLMRSSRDADELKHLQAAYGTALAASPWSFGVNASFLPSTNINKTSSNEVFHTPLGSFQITNGGAEKSGLGLRLGARATHETMLPSGTTLTYGLELNRSQYPAKRLNRTDGTMSLSLGRYGIGGYTQVTPYLRRQVYDADVSANSTRVGVKLSYEHFLDHTNSVTGTFRLEHRNFDIRDYLDGAFLKTGLIYQGQLSNRNGLKLQLGFSHSAPRQKHLQYVAGSFSGEFTRAVPSLGVVGVSLGLDARRYLGDFPALGTPREDRTASVGLSVRPEKLRVFKTTPKLSCKFSQNWSNVSLYEFRSTDCAVTFERQF